MSNEEKYLLLTCYSHKEIDIFVLESKEREKENIIYMMIVIHIKNRA